MISCQDEEIDVLKRDASNLIKDKQILHNENEIYRN